MVDPQAFSPLIPWLVWIVPLGGALLTPLIARGGKRPLAYAAVAFAFISALLASMMLPAALAGEVVHSQVQWIPSLGVTAGVLADPLSIIMANVVAWISLLIMIYSIGYMHGESNLTRYWFFMNFFIANMQLIVLSDNFLQLFFGWEGVGLASYALIGFWHSDEKKYWVGTPGHKAAGISQAYSPSHAGMKALVTTRVGDISFLIGLLILFFFAGTFDFLSLSENTAWAGAMASAGLLIPVAVLIFGGAIGKSAQFPLHVWLPDAMTGPTAVSALIHAATMVKAGVFLVGRTGPIFYNAAVDVGEIVGPLFQTIAWIGVFTAFLAATQALVAKELKKVLAYSTMSQIGYMMLALGAAGLAADFVTGYTAGFFHLISHAVFKAALFMGAGALIHAAGSKYMSDMGGLRRNMKITFYSMLIAAFALSGIPPLSGFWSKDAVLASTLQIEGGTGVALFAVGIVTALITALYSFRMLGMIFWGEKSANLQEMEKKGHNVHEAPRVMWATYGSLAVATVAIGITGFFFEGSLRDILGGHLENTFSNIQVGGVHGLNFLTIGASLAAVAIGGFLGYTFYIARKFDAVTFVSNSAILSGLYRFLDNRWYINSFYYIVFVEGMERFGRRLFKAFETGVVDKSSDASAEISVAFSRLGDKFDASIIDGIVNGTKSKGQRLSGLAKRVQSGVTEEYAFAFVIGILVLALVMIFIT